MTNLREELLNRSRCVIVSMLSLLSESMHLSLVTDSDFVTGAWTPLNINHDNTALKCIAKACLKEPQRAKEYFIESFSYEVLSELEAAFESWYYDNPTKAHDISIQYEVKAARLRTFIEVIKLLDTPESPIDVEVLSKWLEINPVQIAIEDWS